MNLFVLVSTGQKVANLPPVLEHAHPGDHMLWVESDEARRENWTAAPCGLLEERGLVTVATIPISQVNDPALLTEVLAPFAGSVRGQYENVYLVANGGTKLSPVGLLFGLESLSPQMLYGDEKPTVHSLYPHSLNTPPLVEPYRSRDLDESELQLRPLDLPDILRLNGYTFSTDSPHVRIWPVPLPRDWTEERYGLDEVYTSHLHAQHHARATATPAGGRVPFATLGALVPNLLKRWNGAVRNIRERLTPENQAALYNSTLNMDEAARRADAVATVCATPPPRIDDAFERAVARRVREWLVTRQHPAIRSVWAGVGVARENSPHRREVQFDILLVLTNGVLFHLECKSALVNIRDLDARIHRLRETGSKLARLAVVLPLYTRQSGQDWFQTLHAAKTDVQQARLTLLPFTWPGQTDRYSILGTERPEEFQCPEFEAELDKLFRPYHPQPGLHPEVRERIGG